MRFQSHLGQTKVDFNNQGKNAPQCIAFWLEIFLFKIEIACGKKLKLRVATSLKHEFVPEDERVSDDQWEQNLPWMRHHTRGRENSKYNNKKLLYEIQ